MGNLDAKRDWGHAKDYVEAMWLMLQHDHPEDFVISMNETHSVRDFIEIAAKHLDMKIEWSGQGIDGAWQGPDSRGHHRRRACGGSHHRVHRGDAQRDRAEPDPGHHSYLSHAGRGQQVRRRQLEARPRAAEAVALG